MRIFEVKARHGLPSQERELTAKRPFLQSLKLFQYESKNVAERDESSGQLGERIWIRHVEAFLVMSSPRSSLEL